MSIILNGANVEVYDCHVHTFPENVAPKALRNLSKLCKIKPKTNGTIVDTIEKLKKCNIDRAFSLNIATSPKQQTTINNSAIETNEKYGDFFEAFGSIHFLNEEALTELDRVKSLGVRGIKFHPDYQNFMIDDKRLYPIYEKCADLALPVVFHAGYDCYSPNLLHTPPELSKKVVKMFPKLKIILAHFGGLEKWDDVEKYLVGENVYFDTSMCATYSNISQIERLIKNHDENKILFGSDSPWEDPKESIDFILNMNLSDKTKIKILSGNAKELFL